MTIQRILFDADPLIYAAAFGAEEVTEWDWDLTTWHARPSDGIDTIDSRIAKLQKAFPKAELIVCLSDPHSNYRKELMPQYKANRVGMRKPLLYRRLRQHLVEQYDGVTEPSLEADDLLGLWANDHSLIVSADKDLMTVPGPHLALSTFESEGRVKIDYVSPEEADYFWMVQTLVGDRVDGYPGCPKIGEIKAARLLAELTGLDEWWPVVEEAYIKAGKHRYDAILNARCARILRAGEYDFQSGSVKLWTPPSTGESEDDYDGDE